MRGTAIVGAALAVGEWWARSSVPEVSTTIFQNSAIEGLDVDLKRDFQVVYQGHSVDLHSRGFRGPEFPTKREGELRIALIGDSVAFGNGIAWEDTLGVMLEEEFAKQGRPAQVLNFGVPGYNIGKIVANLEGAVLKEEPTHVIYLAFPNDHLPLPEFGDIDPNHQLDPLNGFPLGSALAEWTLSHLKDMARSLGRPLESRTHESSREEYEAFGRDEVQPGLERMQAACAAGGVGFAVVIHPFMLPPTQNSFRPLELAFEAECVELGIEAHLGEQAFAGRNPRELWAHPRFDSHPNGEANRLTATWLVGRLFVD